MSRTQPLAACGAHTTPVGDELLVHLAGAEETHLLSPSTTQIWTRCDGQTSKAELAEVFKHEPAELRPELVEVALDELACAGLLVGIEAASDVARQNRRRFLRNAAIAAVSIPVVTTIVTATPAAAQSAGDACATDADCRAPLVCNNAIGNGTCQPRQANGGACAENADCVAGSCCKRTGSGANTCITGNGGGACF